MKMLDLKRRKSFEIYEAKRKSFRAVATNQNLKMSMRWWAELEKSKLPRRSSLSRVHNHCIDTSRSRGVIGFYKISRLQFRCLVLKGFLAGLRKGCW